VELDEDIYCYTIVANVKSDIFSQVELQAFLRKTMTVFMIQISLSIFFLMYMNDAGEGGETKVRPSIEIQEPHTANQLIRLIGCFLMHLFILPDVRQALTLMAFMKYTQDPLFRPSRMTNFLIALMKLLSALICQSVLILMMASSGSISDMIKDFVAIGFVVEIDNQFASTMKFDGLT